MLSIEVISVSVSQPAYTGELRHLSVEGQRLQARVRISVTDTIWNATE